MTAVDLLRQRGPMPVAHIATVLQVPEVDVYTELMRAYDAQLARPRKATLWLNPGRDWEAMEAPA